MKKCTKCGKEANDYENYCSNCGGSSFEKIEQYAPSGTVENENYQKYQQPSNGYYQQNINQNQTNNGNYYNPFNANNEQFSNESNQQNDDKKNIDDAKICGIVSLAIMIFGLFGLSWIPALIGKNKLKNVQYLRQSSEFDTAKLLNNIGMIISIVSIVIGAIAVIAQILFLITGFGIGFEIFNDLANDVMMF